MPNPLKFASAIVLIIFCLLTSCKSAKENDKDKEALSGNLKTFFLANTPDSLSTLDSFNLVRIDTITKSDYLLSQFKALTSQRDYVFELYKQNGQKLSMLSDQIRLYKMIQSPDLVTIKQKEAKANIAKGLIIKSEIDTLFKILDTLTSVLT
jgi:hypothetical protein